jgi:hypothetical protein
MTTTLDPVLEKIKHDPSPRCSDFDEECVDVVDPFVCWSNCRGCFDSVADGFCPLMFKQ